MDASVRELVRELFASRPDEFVAARNALVSSRKRDGDRASADLIAALRRPSWIDGALDHVARDRADLVAAFVEAATTARRIQDDDAQGNRTASLADALRTVRSAMAELAATTDAALVGWGRKSDLPGVSARLGQISADPTALGLLTDGVLGLEHPDVVDAFVTSSPSTPARSDTRPGDDDRHRGAVDEAAPAEPDHEVDVDGEAERAAERRRTIDAAIRDARTTAKDAAVAATAARRAAERRDRAALTVEAAEQAVDEARNALARAEAQLAEAQLAEHDRRAADARRSADEAAAAAETAAARVAELTE